MREVGYFCNKKILGSHKKLELFLFLLYVPRTLSINTVKNTVLFNHSNQQMSGSRYVLCIVLLF